MGGREAGGEGPGGEADLMEDEMFLCGKERLEFVLGRDRCWFPDWHFVALGNIPLFERKKRGEKSEVIEERCMVKRRVALHRKKQKKPEALTKVEGLVKILSCEARACQVSNSNRQ